MIFLYSLAAVIIFATLVSYTEASMFNSQPKFILKAENNKAFDNSSLVKTFNMKSESIAECLEHCLQDCRCQSFQICQNTKCQLCSSHKEENSSLPHEKKGCVYVPYEVRQSTKIFQVQFVELWRYFIRFIMCICQNYSYYSLR